MALARGATLRLRSSYHDNVQTDMSNRVFYIYHLGRFNNRHIYHYGEASDAYEVAFRVHRTLPFYKRILCIPAEEAPCGLSRFDSLVQRQRCTIPVHGLEEWAAFSGMDPHEAVDIAMEVYKDISGVEN